MAHAYTPAPLPPRRLRGKVLGLDGLRAFAVAVVVAHHLAPGDILNGGVEIFLVLSGYLITTLLLAEKRRSGRIDYPNFLLRRLLRLYPALFVTVLLTAVWLVGVGLWKFAVKQAAYALTYTFDLWTAIGHVTIGPLGHTWSLALEEQFYLTWPFLLLAIERLCHSPRARVGAVAVLGAIGVVFQVVFFTSSDNFSPQARLGALLVGCFLAVLLETFPRVLHRAWLGVAALGFAGVVVLVDVTHVLAEVWVNPLVTGLALLAVWVLATADDVGVGVLSNRVTVHLGQISYAIYLWHYPLVYLATYYGLDRVGQALVAVPGSLLLAELSKRFVENPFLAMKDRLRARADHGSPDAVGAPEVAAAGLDARS